MGAGLTNVINAIAKQEGYGASPTNIPTRSNNPGDLNAGDVGLGTSAHGETIYPDIQSGMAALKNQIDSITNGTSTTYNTYAKSLGLSSSADLTLAQVGHKYAEDPDWAAHVAANLGVDPNTSFAAIVNGTVSSKSSGKVNFQTVDPPGNPVTLPTPQTLQRNPSVAQAVVLDNPDVNFNSLFPDVIVNTGLNETPWYSDKDLVTGNPKVRGSVNPVVFEILLKGREEAVLSTSSTSDTGGAYKPVVPIQVQLNASMKKFSVASKHVYHQQRTRVGWHLTFWGMQADLIEGNCTTGVFMNQLGITDFFSLSDPSTGLVQTLTNGFQNLSTEQTGHDPAKTFRVAAQDAFIEFLSLFKNNGTVWFSNNGGLLGGKSGVNASGVSSGIPEQVGVDEWSPQVGLSATSRNARNNDVMTRGAIIMKFKGTNYLGYFKSITWQQDAVNPFQWTFNFVFQVERTLGYVFSPAFGSPMGSASSVIGPAPTLAQVVSAVPQGVI